MTIKIGGKDRPVKYNLNAVIEFEELTGIDITKGSEDFARIKNMRALAFCGLKHGAKTEKVEIDFTIDDVGDWLGFGDGTIESFLNAFRGQSTTPDVSADDSGEAGKK